MRPRLTGWYRPLLPYAKFFGLNRCHRPATTRDGGDARCGTIVYRKFPTGIDRSRSIYSNLARWGSGVTELLNTLYVQSPGTSLHLDGDTVRVYRPEQTGRRLVPLVRIDHVVLFGGTTISDDLLLRCADDGRSVSWLTGMGRFRARVVGPATGNPLLRRAQHNAATSTEHSLRIAQAIVAGKIHNTRQVLLRAARDAAGPRQDTLRTAADLQAERLALLPDARSANEVLGVEGVAARDYFGVLPSLASSGGELKTVGRSRRPPTDPVNCILSFLYGLLRVAVHGALEQVGLDPYIGFLHGLRPGKPALALDLMEEFRPLFADRLAFTMVNRRELTVEDFERLPNGAVRLTEGARKTVLYAWQQSRQREWRHAQFRRDIPAAVLPLVQARLLARHLRGDLDGYQPWTVT
jgi:CRISPR-associated protein Cas1